MYSAMIMLYPNAIHEIIRMIVQYSTTIITVGIPIVTRYNVYMANHD